MELWHLIGSTQCIALKSQRGDSPVGAEAFVNSPRCIVNLVMGYEGPSYGISAKKTAQSSNIGARFLAVKTGKELGAFNEEVPADRISHDTTPQPMLCEAVSAYRQQARAHS